MSQPWISEWKTPPKSATSERRKKAKNEVIYPIFEECAKAELEEFFSDLLSKAARGKFPSGFYYQNGVLNFKKKGKQASIHIPRSISDDTPIAEILNRIVSFFRECGIRSKKDEERSQQLFEQYVFINENIVPKELQWNKMSKGYQEDMLDSYMRELTSRLSLNKEEQRQLKHTLSLGKIMGNISPKTVVIEDREIAKIDGLVWSDENRDFMFISRMKATRKSIPPDKLFGVQEKTKEMRWSNYMMKMAGKHKSSAETLQESSTHSNSGSIT